MSEQWKPIKGYEGKYEVSDHGNVRRCHYAEVTTARGIRRTEALYPLNPYLVGDGLRNKKYYMVRLYKDKKFGDFGVHRLVLEAFVGPCPPQMQCCHNDGNPQNNHVSNLRWGSSKENADDRERHGTHPKGSKSSKAKLKEEHIPEIRFLLKYFNKRGNMTILAQRFGVDVATIRDVRDKLTWQQIPDLVYTTSQISRECPNCNKQTTHTLHSTTNTDYDVCFCNVCNSFKFHKDEFYQEPFRDAIIVRKTTASHRGASTPNSKLTEEQVKEIRQKRKDGELLTTLAEEYKVSVPSISGICTGRTWKHLSV